MANWSGYGSNLPLHDTNMSRFSTGSPEPDHPMQSRPFSRLPTRPFPNSRPHHGGLVDAPPAVGGTRASPQYNPAVLLNPRGYQEMRQPQRPAFGHPTQDFSFQFDSPSSSHTHPTEQQQHINGAGMGSMVERMHNVADRSQVPPIKRQKTHDFGRESEGRSTNGFNVLGNYVREQRDTGLKDERKSTVVDLESKLVNFRSNFLTLLTQFS